jgi:hypothetical protein
MLQDLYNGKIRPSKDIGFGNKELQQINEEINDLQARYLVCASEDEQTLLNELYKLQKKQNEIYAYESFAHGFRLGLFLLFVSLNSTAPRNL